MISLTADVKATLMNSARFANRGSGRTLEDLEELLTYVTSTFRDAESLADALRYYGFIGEVQALKMSQGQDWMDLK